MIEIVKSSSPVLGIKSSPYKLLYSCDDTMDIVLVDPRFNTKEVIAATRLKIRNMTVAVDSGTEYDDMINARIAKELFIIQDEEYRSRTMPILDTDIVEHGSKYPALKDEYMCRYRELTGSRVIKDGLVLKQVDSTRYTALSDYSLYFSSNTRTTYSANVLAYSNDLVRCEFRLQDIDLYNLPLKYWSISGNRFGTEYEGVRRDYFKLYCDLGLTTIRIILRVPVYYDGDYHYVHCTHSLNN